VPARREGAMDLEEQIRKYEEETAQRQANPTTIPKSLGNVTPDGNATDLSREI